ncbi:T6SS phospholipase effector Tle1-like catalytic domain-containing protein [Paraburkholderia sp. GAS334]|uniref:T6SS phospholipase effector Tle1-like catalytic domain-containing protein n=1 Tax=Paraburkholderia sp. GAS334 TaxID=3035131 RepID=UPI003D205FD1
MSYTITAPEPLPADGYRKLSPRDMARRAAAMDCIHKKEAGQCPGQVYVTLFFDGTGNNQDWIEPKTTGTQRDRDKHSNIARLFNAATPDPDLGFFPYCISGVGTPFKEIGDSNQSGSTLGLGAGYMGADRINWGITRVLNAVHYYVTGTLLLNDAVAKVLVNSISSGSSTTSGTTLGQTLATPAITNLGTKLGQTLANMAMEKQRRIAALRQWEDRLAAVLKSSQRKVTSVNVAVLGFSRGAAEARAFANWLSELLKRDDGGYYTLAGVPLRLYFLGLFDTVASVGVPNMIPGVNGHMAWADGTQSIPGIVEQCVHFIALHEQRACFPLEMVDNVRQIAYPGMHSDVGGGYLPTEQGKSGQLSQIPLNDMYYEALKAGVPLHSRDEINSKGFEALKKQFDIPADLLAAYKAYWSDSRINTNASGNDGVLDVIHQHTRQYLQWRKALPAKVDLENRDFYNHATTDDRDQLKEAQNGLAEQVNAIRATLQSPLKTAGTDALLNLLSPVVAAKYAWEHRPGSSETRELFSAVIENAEVPVGVEKLFNGYLHDSRAGFRIPKKMEPQDITGGYLRYRNVYQNNHEQTVAALTQDDGATLAENITEKALNGTDEEATV